MLKSNICLVRKYKEKYESLKEKYDEVYQKNAKYEGVNRKFYEVEISLRKENNRVILELMRIKRKLKEEVNKNKELELEIIYLRRLIKKKEIEEMEEIIADF